MNGLLGKFVCCLDMRMDFGRSFETFKSNHLIKKVIFKNTCGSMHHTGRTLKDFPLLISKKTKLLPPLFPSPVDLGPLFFWISGLQPHGFYICSKKASFLLRSSPLGYCSPSSSNSYVSFIISPNITTGNPSCPGEVIPAFCFP